MLSSSLEQTKAGDRQTDQKPATSVTHPRTTTATKVKSSKYFAVVALNKIRERGVGGQTERNLELMSGELTAESTANLVACGDPKNILMIE